VLGAAHSSSRGSQAPDANLVERLVRTEAAHASTNARVAGWATNPDHKAGVALRWDGVDEKARLQFDRRLVEMPSFRAYASAPDCAPCSAGCRSETLPIFERERRGAAKPVARGNLGHGPAPFTKRDIGAVEAHVADVDHRCEAPKSVERVLECSPAHPAISCEIRYRKWAAKMFQDEPVRAFEEVRFER